MVDVETLSLMSAGNKKHYPQLTGYKGHRLADKRGQIYVHALVIESIIPGVFDPKKGHETHHVDGDNTNNAPTNLVVCDSRAYHKLLHLRVDALRACGDVHKRRCYICKKYDFIENLTYNVSGTYRHKRCVMLDQRRRREGANNIPSQEELKALLDLED